MTDVPSPRSIAVLADVHGNTWALDAVLADIARRGVAQIINLGDSVYGCLDPAGAAERLMQAQIISIAGNQDRIVFDPPAPVRDSFDYSFVTSQLAPEQVAWLQSLPQTRGADGIFCCHGTPASDETYLLERVTPHGVFLNDAATIQAQLHGITEPIVVCGHSHVPRIVWLPDGQMVVNPGSVGIPAYTEDLPYPHVMESGSPHARYAVLTRQGAGWMVEQIAVPYPWHAPAEVARRNERPDRASWIERGRAEL